MLIPGKREGHTVVADARCARCPYGEYRTVSLTHHTMERVEMGYRTVGVAAHTVMTMGSDLHLDACVAYLIAEYLQQMWECIWAMIDTGISRLQRFPACA